jgi:hypothetical protein
MRDPATHSSRRCALARHEQLAGRVDPANCAADQAVRHLAAVGPKAFRAPKRHIGETEVELGDGNTVQGAFAVQGYYEATSSSNTFNYLLTDGEEMGTRLNQAGHWRSVAPGEPGHYQLWANILNHQFQHSPEFMSIIHGDVKTTKDFASWLSKPEQAHLRERMTFYAHDAHDWGGRLLAMARTTRAALTSVCWTDAQGPRLGPPAGAPVPQGRPASPAPARPVGRRAVGSQRRTRMFADGVQRAFGAISEMPTDRLSRHPFFNAVYKREVKAAYKVHVAEKGGDVFTDADRQAIESLARRKALKELKLTLWDISAHSHAAHTLRFLSPFFAAHQEALNRWWNIAKDDPSVARHFQMAFDYIRKAGLTYNDTTGEPVLPGAGIGNAGNKIMLKLPWADDKNAVNKWLLAHGGGKYWSVNENGLNLILQNGIANPGVGPMVTIPVEELVRRYPEATEFEKVARALNQYPPAADSTGQLIISQLEPAWAKRMTALYQGEKSPEFGNYYMSNFADNLTTFRLQYDREPTELELKKIQDKANKETHTDLVLMALSNAAAITPAKPMSKYAVVQNGLQKLYEQMRTEGHDMEWLRSTFRAQYGDAYMAMIYSMGSNPAHLQGSVAEVSAIKKHGYLAKHIDPSLLRMAIGPEVSEADKAQQLYSSSASSWLAGAGDRHPGETFRGKKDPREVATSLVVSQGWDMYDEMTNSLDVMADQQGLTGYEQSPHWSRPSRRAGLHQGPEPRVRPLLRLLHPEVVRQAGGRHAAHRLEQGTGEGPHPLGRVLARQYIQGCATPCRPTLKNRAGSGGNKTIGAKANADLARAFAAGISYINSQSPYFKQFSTR